MILQSTLTHENSLRKKMFFCNIGPISNMKYFNNNSVMHPNEKNKNPKLKIIAYAIVYSVVTVFLICDL